MVNIHTDEKLERDKQMDKRAKAYIIILIIIIKKSYTRYRK